MDKRTPTQLKSPRKVLPAPPRAAFPFWLLVHLILGLVLIVAGALKLYELAFEAQDESTLTLLLMVLAEAELLGGIWLAGWFDPHRTRWWAAAAFGGLALASLSQGLAGKCSCGCFGSLSMSPWFTLVFDLAAVAALLGLRPVGASEQTFAAAPGHWIGLAAMVFLVGAVGWRQADLVTVAGTATADGRPLEEATLTFTGESGQIVLRTNRDGHFQLRLVRPGLYAVATPRRVSAPIPSPKKKGRGPATRSMRTSRQQPSPPPPTKGGETLLWIEIPTCSRYDQVIEI